MLQAKAKKLVYQHVKSELELAGSDAHETFAIDEVFIVWFSKTLENWKALVSTTLPDDMYYEVTYNGFKREAYIDSYKKYKNVVIPDPPGDYVSVRMEA